MSWSEFWKCLNRELLTSGAVGQGAAAASKFCWHPAVYSLGYRKCPIICEHCFPSVIVKLTCDAHVIPYLDSVVQTCIMIVVSCREKFGCFTLSFKCNDMRAKQRNLENNLAWVIDCRYLHHSSAGGHLARHWTEHVKWFHNPRILRWKYLSDTWLGWLANETQHHIIALFIFTNNPMIIGERGFTMMRMVTRPDWDSFTA